MGAYEEKKETCGTICLKYLLFTFNFLFWVSLCSELSLVDEVLVSVLSAVATLAWVFPNNAGIRTLQHLLSGCATEVPWLLFWSFWQVLHQISRWDLGRKSKMVRNIIIQTCFYTNQCSRLVIARGSDKEIQENSEFALRSEHDASQFEDLLHLCVSVFTLVLHPLISCSFSIALFFFFEFYSQSIK